MKCLVSNEHFFIDGFNTGTQKLPQLFGLQRVNGMLLTSKTLDSKEALKVGLVDDVAAQ